MPEASAVGESQSNGLSERVVQLIEDLVRTYKLVLEDRMAKRLSTSSPSFKWILEHAGSVYNRFALGDDGITVCGEDQFVTIQFGMYPNLTLATLD